MKSIEPSLLAITTRLQKGFGLAPHGHKELHFDPSQLRLFLTRQAELDSQEHSLLREVRWLSPLDELVGKAALSANCFPLGLSDFTAKCHPRESTGVWTSLIINRGNSHSVRLSGPGGDRFMGHFREYFEVKVWKGASSTLVLRSSVLKVSSIAILITLDNVLYNQ